METLPTDDLLGRIVNGERLVHIADVRETDTYRDFPAIRERLERGGIRTWLAVALHKDGALLGVITVYRRSVRPFSDKQIALLQNFAAQAVIAMENARLITETREALEQQTATAEVLGVINSSPGDLAPVFDAILEKAHTLCGASKGSLVTVDGEHFRTVATRGLSASYEAILREVQHNPAGSAPDRLLTGERLVHIPDVRESKFAIPRAAADLEGARTIMYVPLRKDSALLGYITAYRQEVRPFSDKQIALLQNFAAQAVIAMENARLITETREALEQQTATAEVLGVINSSPGDPTPVFDAMLEKAIYLCQASFGTLWTYDGEGMQAAAVRDAPPEYVEFVKQRRFPVNAVLRRLLDGESAIQIADLTATEGYGLGDPLARELVERARNRTLLAVALRKEGTLLGMFEVYRRKVRPFTDKQIALLQNFAAQAVIAMENARLINETREALEQQTATAEVLGVINSSPGDLSPVFDTILEKAHNLCGVTFGNLQLYEGGKFRAVAVRGVAAPLAELFREPMEPAPGIPLPLSRLVDGEPIVQTSNLAELAERYPDPRARAVAANGFRTALFVPLRKDAGLLGCIAAFRQEADPFSDKQIALLQNFAAQAVIAMENARLITETREALEQQQAIAEILEVINRSPGELQPIFDILLEKAMQLCGAAFGVLAVLKGEQTQTVAARGLPPALAEWRRDHPVISPHNTLLGRVLRGEPYIHTLDLKEDEFYQRGEPLRRANVDLGGARTSLYVPLLRDREVLGTIHIYRQEVRPFTDKQIALLQSFAAQAVIAMENARLLDELRGRTHDLQESLEYQTATSDVLKVISQSGAELDSVLQTLTETAARICESDTTAIIRLRDSRLWLAASLGFSAEWRELFERRPFEPDRASATGRAVQERRVIHIEDVTTDPEYGWPDSQQLGKYRTTLAVPLLRDDAAIGVITLGRVRVEAFTDKQIALVTTFADQAVIAIENARLFNELRARTTELGSSVAELKMLNDVAQAVSSTLDLRSVLSTILTSSLGMTWANAGAVFRYSRDERAFRLVEAVGWDEALLRSVRDLRLAESETAMGEAVARRTPVQLANTEQRASNPLRDLTLAAGYHSALIVPLLGAERIFGAIMLLRQEAGEFPAETVRLMQTLASQSVLAIQNARLFREIADKSEQLALASQHKSQFLANMSHELRTPLNAILGYAELLVDGIYGALPDRPKGVLERIQNNGKHLLALINDVLDLAKIEAGQLTLTLEDYALPEVVRSVVTATEPLATSKGLSFTATLQDNMPMGHGDARRLSQVLLNLVGNAIKFTDAGEVAISASSVNDQFVLSVSDTGAGIADADQDRIFGEFQQVDNTNTRNKGGTGLGLAISKRMVEMQGGTISVASVLGQGSTFRVVLPVHVDEMMEAAE
jgi:GAF domain-containing protein